MCNQAANVSTGPCAPLTPFLLVSTAYHIPRIQSCQQLCPAFLSQTAPGPDRLLATCTLAIQLLPRSPRALRLAVLCPSILVLPAAQQHAPHLATVALTLAMRARASCASCGLVAQAASTAAWQLTRPSSSCRSRWRMESA